MEVEVPNIAHIPSKLKEFIVFLLDLTNSKLRGMTFERFVFISELHSIVYVDGFTAFRRLSLAIVV